jgi:hypothetical protein
MAENEFEIEYKGGKFEFGATYRFTQNAEGKQVVFQRIEVGRVGFKEDPETYGRDYRPTETMRAAARKIAIEILEQADAAGGLPPEPEPEAPKSNRLFLVCLILIILAVFSWVVVSMLAK